MRLKACVITVLAMSSASVYAQSQGAANNYPNRPIRLVVPFTAGTASDFLARQLAEKMSSNWGQQVVVDNRPSAAGVVAGEIVTGATPDGHTLMVTSSGIAASAAMDSKLPFDTVRDFASVSRIATGANMYVVAPNSPIKSMKVLIDMAKKAPGKMTYGHSGIGSGTHYAAELFNMLADIKMVHVPYKGAPAVLTDTLSARLDVGVVPVAPAISMVRSGRVTGLAVTTDKRNHALPDVPTIAESGLPGYAYDGWFGMFAPSKLPPAIMTKLNAEVTRVLNLPDVRERIMAAAMTPSPTSPEEMHKILASEIQTRRKVFGAIGLLK
jgi:tripartite-type tricarboxylate transporter receptor subunit TctC